MNGHTHIEEYLIFTVRVEVVRNLISRLSYGCCRLKCCVVWPNV